MAGPTHYSIATWHANPMVRCVYRVAMWVMCAGVRLELGSEVPKHIARDWQGYPPRRNLARVKILARRRWAPIGRQIGATIREFGFRSLVNLHRRLDA